jgi:hypothetical protein
MTRRIAIGTLLLATVAAVPVFAGFGAADLHYIPVVSKSPGAFGSNWVTDIYITNVDDTAIDVALLYLPSGQVNNSGLFVDRDAWLGGRESDSFGVVNEALASIPPNGTVVLRDPVGEYWASVIGASGNGAMVVASYEADTLEDDGTRVYRNAIVNARIYNDTTIWIEDPENPGEFVERQAEYGQTMPGVPWYNLADGGAVTDEVDLSFEVLTGGEETDRLRFNVGVVNASDPLTSLTVEVQPLQDDGEPFLDDEGNEILTLISMPPGSHIQLFRPFTEDWAIDGDVEGSTIQVRIAAWSSAAADPRPMMSSYGSVVNNRTSDPSSVLPSFADPYDVECMWGSGDPEGLKGARPNVRPVAIPPK